MDVVEVARPRLWATVLAAEPYRKYYVYLAPAAERPAVLPQLLSIYAVMYYLGSITRYHPQDFDTMREGKYGPMIEAFLNDQPMQFIYLLASVFTKREITKAAIV